MTRRVECRVTPRIAEWLGQVRRPDETMQDQVIDLLVQAPESPYVQSERRTRYCGGVVPRDVVAALPISDRRVTPGTHLWEAVFAAYVLDTSRREKQRRPAYQTLRQLGTVTIAEQALRRYQSLMATDGVIDYDDIDAYTRMLCELGDAMIYHRRSQDGLEIWTTLGKRPLDLHLLNDARRAVVKIQSLDLAPLVSDD